MYKAALALSLALVTGSVTLASAPPDAYAEEKPRVREVQVVVEGAYSPSRIEITEGERLRLKFVRKDYGGCTREVVFPSLNIRRELPTNKPVVIELPALPPGEVEFRCGMNMIRGTIIVHPKSHGHH